MATLIDADAKLALALAELQATPASRLLNAPPTRGGWWGYPEEALAGRLLTLLSIRRQRPRRTKPRTATPRIKDLKGAIPPSDVVSARLPAERARALDASVEPVARRAAELEAEITRHVNLENRRQGGPRWKCRRRSPFDQAKLALDRTRISPPVDGRVLRLLAAPGQKKMLPWTIQIARPSRSSISLTELQVRVDVPLADAAAAERRPRANSLPPSSRRTFPAAKSPASPERRIFRATPFRRRCAIIDRSIRCGRKCSAASSSSAAASERPGHRRIHSPPGFPRTALRGRQRLGLRSRIRRVTNAVQATDENREAFLRIAEGLRPGEHVVVSPRSPRRPARHHPKQP